LFLEPLSVEAARNEFDFLRNLELLESLGAVAIPLHNRMVADNYIRRRSTSRGLRD
jgi:hypothetical protein